jgi:hypothetical protein
VLPRGFRRARSYGFLHACSKKLVRFLKLVLRTSPWRSLVRNLKQRPAIICPACGAAMAIIATMIARPPALAAPLQQ